MATMQQRHAPTGGTGLFLIGTAFYLAFIGLFLWQTAAFVSWLFPQDQILYRVITVSVFDVMALFWACVDTFYRFATRASHSLVKWSWAISFVAALIASIFYMVLQSMTRLNFIPDAAWVDTGYAIVIAITVLQILFLTFFIRIEWMVRHPRINDYEYEYEPEKIVRVVPATAPAIPAPAPAPAQKVLTAPAPAQKKLTPLRQQPRQLKKLPRARKFTPRTPAQFIDTEEVSVPGPLAPAPGQPEIRVRRNQGPYVVNKNSQKIPLND